MVIDVDDPFFRYSYPNMKTKKKKEVISIPVHFLGSGSDNSKSDSALKIQKAFRGFRVRNSLNKILAIRRQVDLVEKKLEERETVELVKRDDRERLKMTESLMALLFKLDSVRSVNDAVRECRKAAINKAIMLQERIDSFLNSSPNFVDEEGELKENMDDSSVEVQDNVDKTDQAEAWECVTEDKSVSEADEWFLGEGEESQKLLEKMAEDNHKLLTMVTELCNRNAAQASLISSLSQRVEHLEKAMSHSLRNKKKKKNKIVNTLTHTTT